MNPRISPRYWLTAMLVLLIILTLCAANIGPVKLSFYRLISQSLEAGHWNIWLNIRLPRVLLAVLIGAALAVSGAIMQGLFRNPLADPGLLGISTGAALCVAVAILFPLPLPGILVLYGHTVAAFVGSIAVCVLLYALSRTGHGNLNRLLLAGIALNALAGAAIGVLSYISDDQQLRQFSLWSMGSLGRAQWSTLAIASSLIIPAIVISLRLSRLLNLLQLGDEEAHYLGVNVESVKQRLLLLSALLIATCVAMSGAIGFIGLVIPHLIRLQLGVDHRWLLPGSVLGGACLLLIADTLARTLASPAEIPVGLITSLLGGPYFLWLILRRREINNA
ncbi:FecCD family ABC transporter permease [Pragia fontium]|uniref:Iron ABC transporter n=1 Tax=Pragia fontium TaxID=82985 RepID=A0ABQ5LJI3_9GAMM|nr:iron ABC transporter permease [Pragia fontium]GKX63771.1 iron ABC transporter [Pragia fontium]VEJ57118.1 Probable ABC transporter permease protein HI_1471 [Pragia fontium]